jgi:two-component system sensor histidine kinase KdpD
VAASAVARVFEPFYRTPSDARSAGSGIGLAVARGLVAAHGGRIWIEGRGGGGECFTCVIPSPRAPEPNDA